MPNRRITPKDYDQITEMLLDKSGKSVQLIAETTGFSLATIKRLDLEIKRYAKKHGQDTSLRTCRFDVQKRTGKARARPNQVAMEALGL